MQLVKHLAEQTQQFDFSPLAFPSLTLVRAVLYLIHTTSSTDPAKKIIKSEITFKEMQGLKMAAGRPALEISLNPSEVSPLLSRTGYSSQCQHTWEDKSIWRQRSFGAMSYQSDSPPPTLPQENGIYSHSMQAWLHTTPCVGWHTAEWSSCIQIRHLIICFSYIFPCFVWRNSDFVVWCERVKIWFWQKIEEKKNPGCQAESNSKHFKINTEVLP